MSKRVLITGASSGIGLACLKRFHENGYIVAVTVRKDDDEKRLMQDYPGISIINVDLRDEAALQQKIEHYLRTNNGVDIIVNNAGFACIGAVEELSMAQWRQQMDTNFFAVVNICRMAIPYMREQGHGRIIQISSGIGQSIMPIFSPYATSKHALEAFSESLRYEVKPFGIDVSMVAPGPVRSSFDSNREVPTTADVSTSPYQQTIEFAQAKTADVHSRESSPDAVVDKVILAATASRPKLRYSVGILGFAATLYKFIPKTILDRVLVTNDNKSDHNEKMNTTR